MTSPSISNLYTLTFSLDKSLDISFSSNTFIRCCIILKFSVNEQILAACLLKYFFSFSSTSSLFFYLTQPVLVTLLLLIRILCLFSILVSPFFFLGFPNSNSPSYLVPSVYLAVPFIIDPFLN